MKPFRLLEVLVAFTALNLAIGGAWLLMNPVRVETEQVPPAALTTSASSADVAMRLGPSQQSFPGTDLNPNMTGITCDAYQLADGAVFVCHQ